MAKLQSQKSLGDGVENCDMMMLKGGLSHRAKILGRQYALFMRRRNVGEGKTTLAWVGQKRATALVNMWSRL